MRPTWEGVFHITARSNAEERIFRDDGDYLLALTILASAACRIHLLCLMPTHYHLLATVGDGELSSTIHRINRSYATAFNRRWRRHGHVFDSPTTTKPVVSEAHLLEVIRYVANNPKDPEGWPYSSYGGTLGVRPQFSFFEDELVKELFSSLDDLGIFVADRRMQEPGSANQVPGLRA